jgi:hypothetical protein
MLRATGPQLASRRRLLQMAAAMPLGALGGCVAMPYGPYFRPSTTYPRASFKGAWCHGAAGPLTRVELTLADAVRLSAEAHRPSWQRDRSVLPLQVVLTVPPAWRTRFTAPAPRLVALDDGRELAARFEARASRLARVAAAGWLSPAAMRPAGAGAQPVPDAPPFGTLTFDVAGPPDWAPERVVLDGIALERDDGTLRMPAIELQRHPSRTAAAEYRSEAYQARLRARAEACRSDTPQRACQNIVEFANEGFIVDGPPARWKGRLVLVQERDGVQRLRGEVSVELPDAQRFRLAVPSRLRMRDLAGADPHETVIAVAQYAVQDRLAFDAPVNHWRVVSQGYTYFGSGDSTVHLQADLPADTGSFELRLPALEVQGLPETIPPIRFERRLLDGGVEPFNC